jgi:hypothetical protein
LQGNVFKNKEILNGWKEIMFFENGSTAWERGCGPSWYQLNNERALFVLHNFDILTG